MTLFRWLIFLLRPQTVIHTVLLGWFLSFDAIICCIMLYNGNSISNHQIYLELDTPTSYSFSS